MTPQLIPVSETYDALVAWVRKTAVSERAWSSRLPLLLKTFPQWPHTSWAFTVHEYLPGSRLLLCANNLLHVSKGFIFRWTLFIWECRSSDIVNFLSHCEQGKREPLSHLWCWFLWRTRFLFCTYDFPHSWQRCRSTGTYFCGAEVINIWPVV